jgi:hypothetical protein
MQFQYGWGPGPMLFFEKHWGSHAQHSISTSVLTFADDALEVAGFGVSEGEGDYTEIVRISYRRYTSREASARGFVELGVVLGEIDIEWSYYDWSSWPLIIRYDDHYQTIAPDFVVGIGLRFRGRGGRSSGFADLSLSAIHDVDYDLFGVTHTDPIVALSLMFGWSIP